MSKYKLDFEQRGRAAALYSEHADGEGIDDLVYEVIWLRDRVEELESALGGDGHKGAAV